MSYCVHGIEGPCIICKIPIPYKTKDDFANSLTVHKDMAEWLQDRVNQLQSQLTRLEAALQKCIEQRDAWISQHVMSETADLRFSVEAFKMNKEKDNVELEKILNAKV